MDTINVIKTYVAVATEGSFVAGADKLGISTALASKYVGVLEDQLGVRLLNRSTRSLGLTEIGLSYLSDCVQLLSQYDDMVNAVQEKSQSAGGELRLTAPTAFGELHLVQAIHAFREQYPGISVDLDLSDRRVDLLSEAKDLAIRDGILDDSMLVCKRILAAHTIFCATPQYLASAGEPAEPSDLAAHNCILDSTNNKHSWYLRNGKGQEQKISISGRFAVNSLKIVRECALRGEGIAKLPYYCVADDLREGRLVPVLKDYSHIGDAVYAIYPHSKYLPHKVRLFVDFIAEWFVDSQFNPEH